MEKVVMRRRFNYLSVVGKVTLKNLNEKKKENISEEEEIGIRKCRRKSRIDKYNEEVRGWTSSSKNPECPPERTKKKDENRLENKRIKFKKAALE